MSIKEEFWQFWVRREGGRLEEGYAVVCTPDTCAMIECYRFDETEECFPAGPTYWVGWSDYEECVRNWKAIGFTQGAPGNF